MKNKPFNGKRYATFAFFIEAIESWLHGDGAESAQLCGCVRPHRYRSDWTSFKLQHFGDESWNGPYVVNADTTREALLDLVEMVKAGTPIEDIFTPDRTDAGTRTVRVADRSRAAGFYVYKHRTGVPLFAETRQCRGDSPKRKST